MHFRLFRMSGGASNANSILDKIHKNAAAAIKSSNVEDKIDAVVDKLEESKNVGPAKTGMATAFSKLGDYLHKDISKTVSISRIMNGSPKEVVPAINTLTSAAVAAHNKSINDMRALRNAAPSKAEKMKLDHQINKMQQELYELKKVSAASTSHIKNVIGAMKTSKTVAFMAKNSANIAVFSVFLGGLIYMIARGITVDEIVSSTSRQLAGAFDHIKHSMTVVTPSRGAHDAPGFIPGQVGNVADVGPADGPPGDANGYNADVGPADGPPSDANSPGNAPGFTPGQTGHRARGPHHAARVRPPYNADVGPAAGPPNDANVDTYSAYVGDADGPPSDANGYNADMGPADGPPNSGRDYAAEDERINSMGTGAYTPGQTGHRARGPPHAARVRHTAEPTITGTQVDQTMSTSDNINKVNVPDNYDGTRTFSELQTSESVNNSSNNYGADTTSNSDPTSTSFMGGYTRKMARRRH
jgi:hypothetical protein